jgi:hypothetical protein
MDYSETSEPGMLKKQLLHSLQKIAKPEGISISDLTLDVALSDLVEGLYDKYNNFKSTAGKDQDIQEPVRRVVILIDEYDAPIIDNIDNPEMVTANQETLHDFYRGFKKLDDYIHFIFVTGVSQAG